MANISIFGLGYVGCVAAGCLARLGHRVIGVDCQQSKVDFINAGRATIIEEGIDDLIATQRAAGRLSATTNAAEALNATEITFICAGTPSTRTGHLDLSAILRIAHDIGSALKRQPKRHIIAIRSTVLPGTNTQVSEIIAHESGQSSGIDFAVVSNPEFLREGTSIRDFEHPPFTLLGSRSAWANDSMRAVYGALETNVIVTQPQTAELMKYVCNSFHALKIAFANEIGNICQTLDIDGRELMDIFCRDQILNISRAYLRPGFAYGGSCLPKDLRALQTIAHDQYLRCPVLDGIAQSNEQQKELALQAIQRFKCQRLGFIGLSFKSGTDDLRESPIVDILERVVGKGYQVRIYDPNVQVAKLTGSNRDYILTKIPLIATFITNDLQAVLSHAEGLVIVNDTPELKPQLARLRSTVAVLDLARGMIAPRRESATPMEMATAESINIPVH